MKRKIIAYVVSAVMVLTMIPATAFAATDTGAGGVSKTAPDALTQAQESTIAALEKKASDDMLKYDSEGLAEINSIVADYSTQIRAAETTNAVSSLDKAAQLAMSKVDEATDVLKAYYDGLLKSNEYDADAKSELKAIYGTATEELGKAKTTAKIDEIIADAKADMDKVAVVDTDLDAAKETAKAALNAYLDYAAYEGATYTGQNARDYTYQLGNQLAAIDDVKVTATKTAAQAVAEVKAIVSVDKYGNYSGTAVIALKAFIDKNATADQEALIEAIATAKPTEYPENSGIYNYGNEANYNLYKARFSAVMKDTGYFSDYADIDEATEAAAYNEAVRKGTLPLVSVDDIKAEIEADVALIPTAVEEATLVTDFTNAVNNVSADDYDGLCDLLQRAGYIYDGSYDNSSTGNAQSYWESIQEPLGFNNTTAEGTLFAKVKEYNDGIMEQADIIVAGLPMVGTAVTYDNYLDLNDDIDAIEDLIAEQINIDAFANRSFSYGNDYWDPKTAADIIVAVKVDYAEEGASATAKLSAYASGYNKNSPVAKAKKITTDANTFVAAMEALAEEMAKEDFAWDFAAGENVDDYIKAYETAYEDYLNSQVYDDENVGTVDTTFAEAMDIYANASAAVKDLEDQINAAELLVGRIPSVVAITDKDAVDAAYGAYVALPEGSKNGYENEEHLKAACGGLVVAYAKTLAKAAEDAKITTGADWSKITADMVAQYDTIMDMLDQYGLEDTVVAGTISEFKTALDAYNLTADADSPTASAASQAASIIKNIPRDPADATEEDFDAVKAARAAYDALLTDEAKAEFEKAGYLAWLEDYEAATGAVAAAADIANGTIDTVEDQVTRGTDPTVVVKDAAGATLTEGTDYTVRYVDDNHAGLATVIATGKGNYSGEISCTFVVVNNAKKIISLKSNAKKTFTVKYSDYSKHYCTGTQIQWKTSKNGAWKNSKMTTNAKTKKISVKTSGKKWVRVRPIVKIDGVRYYGDWSKVKTVKVK